MQRFKPEPMSVLLIGIGVFILYSLVKRGTVDEFDAIRLAVLIPSVILHEISHGALAYLFGDSTAKDAGRLSLNPIRHVDIVGTLLLPAVLILAGTSPFGYAKPVPVNTARMTRNQDMMTALIGPMVNIAIALLAAFILRGLGTADPQFLIESPFWLQVLIAVGLINVTLAVFNLIPIPPLDGSAVVERFLPQQYLAGYYRIRQYSMFILLILVLVGGNLLGSIFNPAIRLWLKLVGWE